MDTSGIEGGIRDTSHYAFDDDENTEDHEITCATCNTKFSTADGGSKYLQKCQLCLSKLVQRFAGEEKTSESTTSNSLSVRSEPPAAITDVIEESPDAMLHTLEPYVPSSGC